MTELTTPAEGTTATVASYGDLLDFWSTGRQLISALEAEVTSLRETMQRHFDARREVELKISNAAGVIRDYISENGECSDELADIAKYLGVELTKEICGTATYEITFTATVPLDFDPDDFEISFDVDCETYEAEDFSWNEDNCEVHAEEN